MGSAVWDQHHLEARQDPHLFPWDAILKYLPDVVCTLLALESDVAQLCVPFDLGVLEQHESEEDKRWSLRCREGECRHDSLLRMKPSW